MKKQKTMKKKIQFFNSQGFTTSFSTAMFCLCLIAFTELANGDDWPNWMGPTNDGIWHEKGILETFPESGAKYVWRVPIGKGYTGPAVVDGKLYVMDRVEKPKSENDADGEDEKKERRPARGLPIIPGTERVLCLDSKTGKEIWKHQYESVYKISYPEGPRTTPLVDGNFVYTLGAMGDLICFQKESGKIAWQKNIGETYKAKTPVWGFSAHPRIYDEKLVLVVGGAGSAVVCLNKADGSEIWKAGNAEEVGYAPPVPMKIGMQTQLVYWSDEAITGLDLETGKQKWTIKFPEVPVSRPTVTIVTPQISGRKIVVSNFYNGAIAVEVTEDGNNVKKLWSSDQSDRSHKKGLNMLMGSPVIRNGHVFGFAGKGEMRCLNLNTGEQIWEDKKPANAVRDSYFATAFFTPHEDKYFIFNDQGELMIAKFDEQGYQEISRTKVLKPITFVRGRNIVWSHPAYADKCMFVRNSEELVCVDLSAN